MEKPNDTGISKTLDHHHFHQPNKNSNSDLDPGASTSRAPSPPPLPLQSPQPTTPAHDGAIVILYKECLKNHAANMGSYVLDGCGEFMPGGEEGTPEALKCAACECHRSFHRREDNCESPAGGNCYPIYNQNHHNVQRRTTYPNQARAQVQAQLPPPHLYRAPSQPIMMAFGGSRGAPADSSSEDLNMFHSNNAGAQLGAQPSFSEPKKRFRTKFSREQKDRMQQFAEKLGWKMQKQDDEEVQQFCNEFGIKRQVFKVWMHNNKQAMKKKQL